MTGSTNHGPTKRDRAYLEEVLYRVAIGAFTYYPDKPTEEPGYTIEEDIEWCLAPLAADTVVQSVGLRSAIHDVITDPGADRQAFIARLRELAPG